MGVPSFYRWLSQRYPDIISALIVDEEEIPEDTSEKNPYSHEEFDCLYLDMNGIIHPCSHPENKPQPETEDDIMVAIFEYVSRLFAIVRPRKLLFLAIDGVAPRAKMNQQRSRRFRSAREAREKAREREEDAELNGMSDSESKKSAFDSNCITPGTLFMEKVTNALQYFIAWKQETDPGWRNILVILSDATVPGEGEHKLVEFLRLHREQPGYNPNTRHVIYGLDADLIMLGLALHDPHLTILREEVFLGDGQRGTCFKCGLKGHTATKCPGLPPDHRTSFRFLHINVLREYLRRDLAPDSPLPFELDLERLIDDWVFLCFFVGNDFIPHLPTLEIREGAIITLMEIYTRLLPELDGYLTENDQPRSSR
eukprot:TRINITY_DN4435_c0_g3_i1.p2 TRINITY_DN4435_c0_g3~~TRINITY_DN4435_c0_g3_i1.p2  ORF type:complete len:369 (-),score=64.17 TRINITY_DN4435_c0_g3_i1:1295-2401(-)